MRSRRMCCALPLHAPSRKGGWRTWNRKFLISCSLMLRGRLRAQKVSFASFMIKSGAW
ncbi:hypothetical protein U0070_023534 [Myodes glareolus]|uniref:Uncharacterized protein n=1 Tax=Myodes glareolus TaxID=447135 RepID=A0AAW0HJY0_MYOGA